MRELRNLSDSFMPMRRLLILVLRAGAVGSSGLPTTRSRGEDRSPPSVSQPSARPALDAGINGPHNTVAEPADAARALTVPFHWCRGM